MYGSVQEWLVQDWKGWRKFENFKILKTLLPHRGEQFDFVFIGDTGELDLEAGMRMLNSAATRSSMRAILMHVVAFGDDEPVIPRDKIINGKPVCYFRTYVGACLKAAECQLVEPLELRGVILQACDDLRASSGHPPVAAMFQTDREKKGPAPSPSGGGAAKDARGPEKARVFGGGASPGEATRLDPKLPSKWRDLEVDIAAAMQAYPQHLGDLDIEALNPLRSARAKRAGSLRSFTDKQLSRAAAASNPRAGGEKGIGGRSGSNGGGASSSDS